MGWKAFSTRSLLEWRKEKHMTTAVHPPIKLFQFPRMFGIPNLSPFCCKLETWLRITRVPYEVVDTPDPRKGPKGKLPFIEDAGMRIADSSRIVDHLVKTREVDPDAQPQQLAAGDRAPRSAHPGRALRIRPGVHTPRQR